LPGLFCWWENPFHLYAGFVIDHPFLKFADLPVRFGKIGTNMGPITALPVGKFPWGNGSHGLE
jgi:hypothetical protein